jgi:hypothetical protein
MQLLLQLAGDRLTGEQRNRVESLYAVSSGFDSASTVCRVPLAWNASCDLDRSGSPLAVKAGGQLQMCQDLVSNPNTSQSAAAVELSHCLAQLTALDEAGDTCRLAMRDPADAVAQTLVKRAQPSFAGDFSTALPLAFSRIGAWWSAAKVLAHGDESWFMGQSSALARWLWETIEAQRMPLPGQPPDNDADAAKLLTDITSSRLTNDLAILNFAYAPGQLNSAPPLLTMTSDALKTLSDRLERIAPIHDVGCRFKPCRQGATLVSSATSELVRALATLPDAAAFTTALSAATHVQQQEPEIYGALTKIRDQHVYLETAWNLLGRPEPFTSLTTVSDPPFEAAGLAAMVRAASIAWASYQATGVFVPWHRPRLTAGTLRQADLVGFVNGLASTTESHRTTYTERRLETVRDLLEQSKSGAALRSQTDQLADLLDRGLDIAGRIDGIEQRDLTERAAQSGFQAQFEALASSEAIDPDAAYQVQTIPPFSASAADSHYPNGGTRNVVRDRFHMERLSAGQTLRVHVTREWSPTCAITNGNIVDPNAGATVPIIIGEALTGPEGYYVLAEDSRYASWGIGRQGSGQLTGAWNSCTSDSLGFGNCTHANLPRGEVTGQVGIGASTKTSATFTSGLRLSTTPYPEAPAGSLVAVITRKNATGGASDPPELDIRVVHRDDVIVATAPPALEGWPNDGEIEVHFVVNDRATTPDGEPCPRLPASALQIELVRSTPLGNVAQPIGMAMSGALAAMEARAPAVIAQGELSGTEATALRTDAWARVQGALLPHGIGLNGLPSELRQLFDTFLERELASIGRRAHRDALQRQLTQLALQIDAIKSQQLFSTDQDRLLHLIPRWRLRDLAGTKLASSAASLSEALTAYAAPVFELRDPASLSNFRAQVTARADDITTNLEITGPYEDVVEELVEFARAVASAVSGAQFELPSSQRRTIVIAIPRPPGEGRAAWTGPWQTVSVTTAKAFWDSVVDASGALSANAVLTLSPADIYQGPGGASRLACMDVAPVIRHAGFFFATDGRVPVLAAAGVEIVTTAAITSPVQFPLVGRTMSFEFEDPLGIPMRVRALNGNTSSVLVDANGNPGNFGTWPVELDAGAGISPFTSFRLDMRVFETAESPQIRDVMTRTNAMFAVFEVERRTTNVEAWVPGVCAAN